MENKNAKGGIANYYPDFLVKRTPEEVWVIETEGREDLDDPRKWERLQQWCADASAQDTGYTYRPMFVREEAWEQYNPDSFDEMAHTFEE